MSYNELNSLVKGTRLQVFDHGEWKSGTFNGFINGADPAMWFAFDERQQRPGGMICTKVYTGLQFTEEYWNQSYRVNKFRHFTEDELNNELVDNMALPQS